MIFKQAKKICNLALIWSSDENLQVSILKNQISLSIRLVGVLSAESSGQRIRKNKQQG